MPVALKYKNAVTRSSRSEDVAGVAGRYQGAADMIFAIQGLAFVAVIIGGACFPDLATGSAGSGLCGTLTPFVLDEVTDPVGGIGWECAPIACIAGLEERNALALFAAAVLALGKREILR